jgi:hypothetical protein
LFQQWLFHQPVIKPAALPVENSAQVN